MCVENMLVTWFKKIQVVSQLLIIDVWNQKSQKNDHMCIAREDAKSILIYVDFSRLCNFILSFPELGPEFLKNFLSLT